MFTISVLKISSCLISVDIVKILCIMMIRIKNVLGKMKDELAGVKIAEFVGLKSKMYSLICVDGKEVNKTKTVNL